MNRPERSAMRFRRDIQGLRALAIVPVVLFHAHVAVLPGGYVGVDIFFVISGYLITGILLSELRDDTFSIAGFYSRRVKRLFPALYLVLAATLVAGLILMPPPDLSLLGRSLFAAIAFIANFNARAGTGYFAEDADLQPLLHLWSLGVEEQFYLLFPLFLLIMWRIRRAALPAALWTLAAASLAVAIWEAQVDPDGGFYLPTTRAYELLAGAILAAGAVPAVRAKLTRDVMSIAGLAMMVAAMALFDDDMIIPGHAALLPVGGAALVIWAGEADSSLGGRLLSWRPLMLTGAISYSLYLWHWPVFVFQRWLDLGTTTPVGVAAAVVLSVLLAALSWRFVERPVLATRWKPRRVLIIGAAVMMAAALVTLPIVALRGLPQRFGPVALAMLATHDDSNPRRKACMAEARHPVPYDEACAFGASTPPDTAVWGDSFAAELAAAMGERAAKSGGSVLLLSVIGCPPTLDFFPGDRRRCADATRATMNRLVADPRIRTVVLALNYQKYPDSTRAQLMDGLARSAATLRAAGKALVLLDPVPGLPFDGPIALMLTVSRGGNPADYGWPRADYDRINAVTLARLDALQKQVGAGRIRPQTRLCSATRCFAYLPGGHGAYFDARHMTLSAARLVITP